MRIIIDFQAAQSTSSRNRGIGRYSNSLVKEIVLNHKNHEIYLVLNGYFAESIEFIREDFRDLIPIENIKVWHAIESVEYYNEENDWRRKVMELSRETFIANLNPDMVILTSLFEGLGDNAVTSIDISDNKLPTALILYDLIPFIYKEIYLNNSTVKKWYENKLESLRRADLVLAISESARQEAIQHLGISPKKVVNISGAADANFHPLNIDEETKLRFTRIYRISKPFIMYTGGIDYRKNIEGLIRAYGKLPKTILEKHQLAIICSIQPDAKKELESLSFRQGLEPGDVILTGFVPDEDLVIFYNLCKLFVFPSFHEGFGLPVLEAMSCGRAVVGANNSSIPEVIGRKDALFDPHSDHSITEKILRVLSDDSFRKSLEEHGLEQSKLFSWEKSANRSIKAIELWDSQQLGKQVSNLTGKTLPKLAYVSPLPPERSGISYYSAELLPELAKYYKIDVITNQSTISDSWIKLNCVIRSYDWLMTNKDYYDRVLYHFGNSPFHKHMFSAIEIIPGVVVLHDFFLSGIIGHLEHMGLNPQLLTRSLYQSHGYLPFNKLNSLKGKEEIIWDYPCNLDVLQNALGVIVHSQYSSNLASQWYGNNAAIDWSVIPLLKTPPISKDKIKTRGKLGLKVNDFIVCSFGMLTSAKLNKRLLNSWLDSSLSKDENCILVFAGEIHEGSHENELVKIIKNSGISHRIRITNWIDSETYINYLVSADIGVQLRAFSRGETSAAILDCLNYGLATIVNSNGSASELADDIIFKIPDHFKDSELINALETLWKDEKKRKNIANRSQDYCQKHHTPSKCAKQYFQSIESFYNDSKKTKIGLIQAIGKLNIKPVNDKEIFSLASTIAQNFPLHPVQKQLFVDVSELCVRDSRSGIQRVVRSILNQLLNNPPDGYRVEPVYAFVDKTYHYARKFTMQFLIGADTMLTDDPIEYQSGDFFLGLDFQTEIVFSNNKYIQNLKNNGVFVFFVVYDLLPVLNPEYFWPGLKDGFEKWLQTVSQSNGVICISKAVADDVAGWMNTNINKLDKHFKIGWFHLGADISSSSPSTGLPVNADALLNVINECPTFLIVGTVEPRKGHIQSIDAFEILWNEGNNLNLVIIGKQGWITDSFIERLSKHPENNKRLFWLRGISDEYLEKIYNISTCLLAPSIGEGFGLPLIEAAQKKIPIIARDLPVFREIAGENAFYFNGMKASDLASSINEWLILYKKHMAPSSEKMSFLTWAQSAEQLKDVIFNNKWLPLA
ncbi:MAG: glycosyl transferase family 1 [Bacteroidetes bacterium GWF2_41_31]|nr:MAG: glycosyl transferase family 1 [Bacteroidetes bacterium GWF2_41_31]